MTNNNTFISTHPLVAVKLSQLRDKKLNAKETRETLHDISLLLAYEATTNIIVSSETMGDGFLEPYKKTEISQRVALVPILRSGLGLVDAFLGLFPDAPVLHLGLYREKVSHQPVEYYNKIPENPNIDICYVLDPAVATSNTAVAAINILKECGISGSQIVFVGVIGSKQGITQLQDKHPDIRIHMAGIDDRLDENGYIRPGIGDTGDRLFSTLYD
ncbi:PRTase-like protein [Backusella circina FSU 941]|nr:PRTase-like protein [Backusella circina FSU 941]